MFASVRAAAARGWHVFPLGEGTKRPAVDRWEERATTDPDRITSWWGRHPDHNYGVACGRSGLVVVDLDRHDEAADGVAAFRQVVDRHGGGWWPDTLQVSTPTGGEHLYFDAGERTLRNTTGRIAPGVDTRAGGGYVVGPGSRVSAGGWRLWCDRPVAPCPPWLAGLASPPPPPPILGTPPPRGSSVSYAPNPGRALRGGASCAGLVAAVATAAVGARNATLHWAACRLAGDWTTGRIDRDAALAVAERLHVAAVRAGLDDDETRRTIRSALTGG
jgi:hypothetical protein